MENDMVERVARAISVREAEIMFGVDRTQQTADPRELSRAAIAAMREPTEAMKAVDGVHWGYGCHVCGGLQEGWYAMIDEALK